MTEPREHSYIPTLKRQFAEGKVDRREFLRTATLLGMSAGAAYAFAGKVTGESFVSRALAQTPKKGGTLRISTRVIDLKNPHTFSWGADIARDVVEYLSKTDQENVTRPYLLESWTASDDLKTWTLNIRKGIKWHDGRDFTADDVVWNLNHVLDADTGSSVLGLMKGYMLDEYDTGQKDENGNAVMSTRLWDANAIEKVDSHTVRLNAKAAQLAVPEHLFHYPFPMIDPEEGGVFGVGSNGTGPFELVDYAFQKNAKVVARSDYWGDGPYVDAVEYIDHGDDPSAQIGALASKQVHGMTEGDIIQLAAFQGMPHLQIHSVPTAQTGVARMRAGNAPWDDPRVRKAMRLAIDCPSILQVAHRGIGSEGEHHHVCQIHPEYAKLPRMTRDPEAAKKLLAEAGHANGIDVEIAGKTSPNWELNAVQGMVEQWADAGIRVTINPMPSAQYWEVWTKVPFGFTSWTHRPLGVMVLGLAYRSGVPWNEAAYANPEFDATLTEAEGILDVEKRREVLARLQTIMQEDGPIVQPLWRGAYSAWDKKVKGFRHHPTDYVFTNELWLDT